MQGDDGDEDEDEDEKLFQKRVDYDDDIDSAELSHSFRSVEFDDSIVVFINTDWWQEYGKHIIGHANQLFQVVSTYDLKRVHCVFYVATKIGVAGDRP